MHEDHRKRVRKRFEKEDLDAFDEHQVLELMLFYAIPRKDTNEIAHRLIEQFGGFAQVMDASIEELEKVEGIGHNSALYLKIIRSSYRYYRVCETSNDVILNTVKDCANYMMARLNGRRNEEVYLLCLDAKRKVISCRKVEEGDACSVKLSIRKITNIAMNENASSVLIAHNHPTGFALPSGEDVKATERLARTLAEVGVYFLDHIIVTNVDYVSMFESGLYSPEALGIYIDS